MINCSNPSYTIYYLKIVILKLTIHTLTTFEVSGVAGLCDITFVFNVIKFYLSCFFFYYSIIVLPFMVK